MKIVLRLALILLVLLSIAAGLAKVLRIPQEVAFFAEAGLGVVPLVALGAMQIIGGTFVWVDRFRQIALLLVISGFFVSVLVILIQGNSRFAAISMLPVLIGIAIVLFDRRPLIDN